MARPKNKRHIILKAASTLFNQKGFHLASISEIAEEAGVGKGTVYEYFRSKDDLFLEVVTYNIQTYLERIEKVTLSKDAFLDQMDAFMAVHSEIISENFKATGHMLHTAASMEGKSKAVIQLILKNRHKVVDLLKGILLNGKVRGELSIDDLDFAADLIYDMIHRLSIRRCQYQLSIDACELERKKLMALTIKGIEHI
ncbi:TetR/AcrR family transcriptional regulator [Fusibacter tunisiensis]|uniref:AcrR family transcriptional regulator n=1 Tax=Fusibacter tunisiensis TaxID=1008308 RepID=A0ABS2MSP6_9FIRM|nr:TetR/AcrR family transcriptional regulator [Fusibacter tunisiensis]MBM7562429.1 AcrR family transcriptional regulator [Fusibacter tunisiensis]